MIALIEQGMYRLSDLFMAPVLCLIVLLFIYSLFTTGQFIVQSMQRRQYQQPFSALINSGKLGRQRIPLKGYPLAAMANALPTVTKDQLDVEALKELEGVRNASRLAPMLGLIATMIPMGPALKSLSDGNIQGISENLIVAFSAVIFGLVIASITFWIATVKKRWLAEELVCLTPLVEAQEQVLPAKTERKRRSSGRAVKQEVNHEAA